MPDRGFSADMLAELQSSAVSICHLMELHFSSGTIYLTDYYRDVLYDSNMYLRTNGLLGFSGLEETSDMLINEITISLSGVDTSYAMDKVLNDNYIGRPVLIYLAFLDDSGAIVSSPEKIFQGTMDSPTINEDLDGGTSTVTVQGVSIWADTGRRPGRHTNHEEQQSFFPGDKGFEFVTEMPKKIFWGRS